MKQKESVSRWDGNNLSLPPSVDEIEISIFGPGYGESILVHTGANDWIIVDSCSHPPYLESTPLKYLRRIGIDPVESVKLVVATHWHDDHIRGLSEVVRNCPNAGFVCSNALSSKEFLTLVSALGAGTQILSSGVREFKKIIDVLKKINTKCGSRSVSLKFATADRLLWQRSSKSSSSVLTCKVYSLSPSDKSILSSKLNIAGLLPEDGSPKKRVVPLLPNYCAVVLWLDINNHHILLGSDLEITGELDTGWIGILNSNTRPQGKASILKIPHHGSSNSDHPRIWEEMLEPNPFAVLSPFNRGTVILPNESDVTRICCNTNNAYSTATVKSRRKKGRSKTVEKTIKETVKSIKEINGSIGHVRLRYKVDEDQSTWTVEMFGDAVPLSQLYL